MLTLWLGLALAQDPMPGVVGVEALADDEADELVIVVEGDRAVERARNELLQTLDRAGFSIEIDRGDYVVMRHVDPWKGEVRVYDDGWIHVKRQPVRVEAPGVLGAPDNSLVAWMFCLPLPTNCVKTGGPLYAKRKFDAAKHRTLELIEDDADNLGDRVADARTKAIVNELPSRLEALWQQGVPFDGDRPLATHAERRAAILDYWESRTDTVWGDRVRAAIESFVRNEVQTSPHGFTDQEVAAFNTRRACERELDLEAPWIARLRLLDPSQVPL